MLSRLVPLNIFRTNSLQTSHLHRKFPSSKQMELQPLQTSGLMESLTSYCPKESHNDPQELVRYNRLDFKFSNLWPWPTKKRAKKIVAETTKMHHTKWQCIRKRETSEFSRNKSPTKESSRPKFQSEDAERKWNSSKPMEPELNWQKYWREEWAGVAKRCPSERSLDYHLFCLPKCQLAGASINQEP